MPGGKGCSGTAAPKLESGSQRIVESFGRVFSLTVHLASCSHSREELELIAASNPRRSTERRAAW